MPLSFEQRTLLVHKRVCAAGLDPVRPTLPNPISKLFISMSTNVLCGKTPESLPPSTPLKSNY